MESPCGRNVSQPTLTSAEDTQVDSRSISRRLCCQGSTGEGESTSPIPGHKRKETCRCCPAKDSTLGSSNTGGATGGSLLPSVYSDILLSVISDTTAVDSCTLV